MLLQWQDVLPHGRIVFHDLCGGHILFHPSTDGHLGGFCILAITNDAAVHVGVQMSLRWPSHFLCIRTQKWNRWIVWQF